MLPCSCYPSYPCDACGGGDGVDRRSRKSNRHPLDMRRWVVAVGTGWEGMRRSAAVVMGTGWEDGGRMRGTEDTKSAVVAVNTKDVSF